MAFHLYPGALAPRLGLQQDKIVPEASQATGVVLDMLPPGLSAPITSNR